MNLGGIPTTLFESEMFGHVRGAFTDAQHAIARDASSSPHGGTIFLDEIGDLDLGVAGEAAARAAGSDVSRCSDRASVVEVDVRVVAATNRNLKEMVERGEFREDLLYRLNLITIHLPPLRDRRDDIPLLATRFLQTVAQVYRREPLTLTDEVRQWLLSQSWPGNVRQLRQWIERAVLVSTRDVLTVDDVQASVAMETRETSGDLLPPVGAMTMDDIERGMIQKALKHHAGNVSRVADALGLSRAALYRRLEKYQIHV